jgi:dihydroorotate dehydrogenase (NAD+) catalytic subunit
MKPDLKVKIKNITFPNPVLVASGTYGYAQEYERFYPVKQLGGIVTKTITLKPRIGNPPQRVVETPGGMLNAIGLQNVGAEKFVSDKLPYLRKLGIPVIVSVMGYSVEEFCAVVEALDRAPGIDGYEMNLSCPNVSYGTAAKASAPTAGGASKPSSQTPVKKPRMFAHSEALIEEVVGAVRKKTTKLLAAKLGPDVSDIGAMAQAVERGGADAVSLINTFTAMVIDLKTRRPVLANRTGGLSGPCVRPVAVRMVSDVFRAVRIPVIGMGGITSARDAAEFMIAGASLVQAGTINFMRPTACPEIIRDLKTFLTKEKVKSVTQLTGSLRLE